VTAREWFTPREAAGYLGLSVSAIRLMIRDGRLPARRLRGSRLLRISRQELERLLEPLPPPARPRTREAPAGAGAEYRPEGGETPCEVISVGAGETRGP
jgi:excisionase family DNA binding protein